MKNADDTGKKVCVFYEVAKNIIPVNAFIGDSVLETAHKNGIELEGACEGSLACSTCHVILGESVYKKLKEPSDKEYDLIDQAFGSTRTSRLGCQVQISKDLEQTTFIIPRATRNMAVDGFKPKPH
ncbi:adrenodoxin-like ferredoxin [Ordospora colligata]|uniref:Adrenodoxin-like ferredoxin n=1 Tax=Ordospora colligata OC4 TaxID=1354746 RepID=A0A0B2UJV9_9MICR|nr:adrenodoxin-like ferredoxin [Ordospora colligata OC4]KHN69322.1 adrenodoxin-like ferredoxin [Ordospora colligata OC4]TBU14836.1 adrenodoxin-like ferredoxin [Ordospora colligata]TBU14967.1 adrenodoxin-like ferredoxin [Ordospora colligata]TBU18351.1 adrenodoxin-like ferredoxin [Ordospora colligata]